MHIICIFNMNYLIILIKIKIKQLNTKKKIYFLLDITLKSRSLPNFVVDLLKSQHSVCL